MDNNLFSKLLNTPECDWLDFKEAPYFQNNGEDADSKKDKTADFVKDILCFANTVRNSSAYIIIGVKKIDGILTPIGIPFNESNDGAKLQEKIEAKVFPIPKFISYSFIYKDKHFDIIEIPIQWYDRICMPIKPLKGIELGYIYIRRGDKNSVARPDEVIRLNEWLKSISMLPSTFDESSISDAIRFYNRTQEKYLEELNSPLGYYTNDEYVELSGEIKDKRFIDIEVKVKLNTYVKKAKADDIKGLHASDIIGSEKKRAVADAYKFLRTSKDTIILLGEPGSGKSVTLRQIALNYIRENLVKNTDRLRLPIYLQLGAYSQKNSEGKTIEFLDFVKYQLKNVIAGGEVFADCIELLLKQMRIVFLLDSMDEMPSGDYSQRAEKIKEFIKTYGATNKIIVACRVREYSGELGQSELIIEPFSKKKIADYLEKAWEIYADNFFSPSEQLDFKDRFLSLKEEGSVFYSFASNPFFIKLLTTYFFGNRGAIPSNIAEVLHGYVRAKLSREKLNGKMKEDDIEDIIDVLSALSFGMLSENHGAYINIDKDLSSINHIKGFHWDGVKHAVHVAIKSRLARIEADNTFRFEHHRLLEYFAAWYWLVNKRHEGIDENRLQNPWMRETLMIRAGLEYNVSEFINELLQIVEPKFFNTKVGTNNMHVNVSRLEAMGLVETLLNCCISQWQDLEPQIKERIIHLLNRISESGSQVEQVRLIRSLQTCELNVSLR